MVVHSGKLSIVMGMGSIKKIEVWRLDSLVAFFCFNCPIGLENSVSGFLRGYYTRVGGDSLGTMPIARKVCSMLPNLNNGEVVWVELTPEFIFCQNRKAKLHAQSQTSSVTQREAFEYGHSYEVSSGDSQVMSKSRDFASLR